MLIKDLGFVLSCKKFSENLLIIKILSNNYGLITGLYRTKNIKNRFNLENVFFEWKGKNRDKLGFFKIESNYDNFDIDDDYLSSLIKASISELSTLFLVDNEYNRELYLSIKYLLVYLEKNKINNTLLKCKQYIIWEINFLKNIGYGIDLTKCVLSGRKDVLKYISPKSGKAVNEIYAEPYKTKLLLLPEFLIKNTREISKKDLIKGLHLNSHFFFKATQDLNLRIEKKIIFRTEILKKINSLD